MAEASADPKFNEELGTIEQCLYSIPGCLFPPTETCRTRVQGFVRGRANGCFVHFAAAFQPKPDSVFNCCPAADAGTGHWDTYRYVAS